MSENVFVALSKLQLEKEQGLLAGLLIEFISFHFQPLFSYSYRSNCPEAFYKKGILRILQISHEITCVGVLYLTNFQA